MSAATPDISVVMTAYNAERYVSETVRSVLNQTVKTFEFIIVNDGSTDTTPAILEAFAKQDSRIRVLHIENSGIPKAANVGLAECRAEFVARIDSDDLAKPTRFAQQLPYIQQHKLVALGTWHDLIDEHGRFLRVQPTPVDNESIQRGALQGHGTICNPTSLIRLKPLLDLGGYSEDFPSAEDLDMWLRLGEVGRLGNLPVSLTQYRLHPNSISELKCQLQRELAKLACERAWARRGISGSFEAGEMWRPGHDRKSKHRFAMEYGWWAFNSGEVNTARSYAQRALRLKPWDPLGYKLMLASLLRPGGGKPV